MTDNLRHWSALEHTDKEATKPFDRGRFKGTATKPVANILKMTEHFGPCGFGWGMYKPEFTLVHAGEELLVFCTIEVWYRDATDPEGGTSNIFGVGGDKVTRSERGGSFNNDEAYKSAYTDALGNAMKHIGVNADIHMGGFDDKYGREHSPRPPEPAPTRSVPRPALPVDKTPEPPSSTNSLRETRDNLVKAISAADSSERVDKIWENHMGLILQIQKLYPESYKKLMATAQQRKQELAAMPPIENWGSAPMLMGEP